jgi:hypothetical protein
MAELKNYSGSCHCKKVTFEASINPDSAMSCNCSICSRVAALRIFVPATQFKLLSGADSLTDYQFGKRHLHHTFCKVCGIHPFASGKAKDGADTYAVNANCLEGLDTSKMKITHYDGAKI